MDVGMEYEILLLQLGSLARKYEDAEEKLRAQEEQLEAAINSLSARNANIEKLQRESLSNSLLKIVGSYNSRVDHEASQAVSAKLEFDKSYVLKVSAHRRLKLLDDEMQEKKLRMREVKEQLIRHNPNMENVISDRDQELINLQYEYIQTIEAQEAAYTLLEVISDIMVNLDSSETISNWELITEIDNLLNHVNRSQLDIAEAMLLDLERKVQNLERELHDLNDIYESQYTTLTLAGPAIEKFFEDLFSEWSTKDIIEKNLVQLKMLEENVLQIVELVSLRKQEIEQKYLSLVSEK